jgi:hypothetical protein
MTSCLPCSVGTQSCLPEVVKGYNAMSTCGAGEQYPIEWPSVHSIMSNCCVSTVHHHVYGFFWRTRYHS